MFRFFLGFTLLMGSVLAEDIVVIGDKNFPKEHLTLQEIRAIFLDKKRYIGEKRILVMNHKSNHPLRRCFEKNILKKSKRNLERYWRKAYYQGKRPPKIVKSMEMLFAYLESVHPSIGYGEVNATVGEDIKVLYRGECL